uniref:Uncharacterized protein n=1 Tax=Panagrolaimus sp. ES5 TaxID=591445 RepID=A0AC34F3Q7_9BILA
MYFISENSSFNESENADNFGTLIGIHENYLYSANSFENELKIYRKKVMETRNWKLFWSCEISTTSLCMCQNTVSEAYGIVGDQLFIAAYGMIPNDVVTRFHLSSINLITNEITDYKTDHITFIDFAYCLCNQCCQSSITSLNPQNPSEICIIPWCPESYPHFSSMVGTSVDCLQIKLNIDSESKICNYLESAGFNVGKHSENELFWNQSNIGILEFGKIVYFRENYLILAGRNASETKLEITQDSDFQNCLYAGFYSTQTGLKFIAFEKGEHKNQQISSIFNVFFDEEKNEANPLYREIQKYSKLKKPKFGDRRRICKKSRKFGLSQNGIKKMLGLPKSYRFCIY